MKQTLKLFKKSPAAHPTAINSFNSNHLLYNQLRPSYPNAIVKAFTKSLGLKPASRILELAAGTGKFTAKLIELGFNNIRVVEPSSGMLQSFHKCFPDIEASQGSSYEIPLPDSSVDAIIVAQGFHWFSDSASLEEMRRVLRPSGRMGLIWNFDGESPAQKIDDESKNVEFVGEILPTSEQPLEFAQYLFGKDLWNRKVVELAYSYDSAVPQYRHGKWKKSLSESEFFQPIRKEIFEFYRVPISYSDVYRYWETRSYITNLTEHEKETFKNKLMQILLDEGEKNLRLLTNDNNHLEKYMGTHAVVIDPS